MPMPNTTKVELRTSHVEKIIAELEGEGYMEQARRQAVAARLEEALSSDDDGFQEQQRRTDGFV